MQSNHQSQKRKNERGMTLIEIMVVVLILGMIASIIGINVYNQFSQAKDKSTKIQMKTFKSALDLFKLNCGFYPSAEQGLDALIDAPSAGRVCKNYTPGGYIEEIPLDPWGNPYVYVSKGSAFVIISFGADGVEGGDGEDADISSDDIQL